MGINELSLAASPFAVRRYDAQVFFAENASGVRELKSLFEISVGASVRMCIYTRRGVGLQAYLLGQPRAACGLRNEHGERSWQSVCGPKAVPFIRPRVAFWRAETSRSTR